jgi:hypothetical protein
LRKAHGVPSDEAPDELARAAASNDVAALGGLLGARDVSAPRFDEEGLPQSLVRGPLECSLLDVAVGAGSVETTKYLLEFHSAIPTRETLKQALSTGNFELIKLVRERLSEAELRDQVYLMDIAAEFHQLEVLGWLLRTVAIFESELLVVFALEQKWADALQVVFENGGGPWWRRTREVALMWRASSQLAFESAPEGFSSEGGWWTDVSGVVWALPALGPAAVGIGGTQANAPVAEANGRVLSVSNGEWTKAMSQALLGGKATVQSVVFPAGVTALGEKALAEFEVLESITIQTGCRLGNQALAGCKSLKAVSLPTDCSETGAYAFLGCSSLVMVEIPFGCKAISEGAFLRCASLASVRIPRGCTLVGNRAFMACSLKEVGTPSCCQIADFAFFACASLRRVRIGAGCTTIGANAFCNCSALASVTLPSTLKSVNYCAFGRCTALATIAFPNGCRRHKHDFLGSPTTLSSF